MANITLAGIGNIHTDAEGRYSLNDFHKAAGGEERHGPKFYMATQQAQDLAQILSDGGIPPSVIRGGKSQGTYVPKEMVYAYAMWISAPFQLKVIRAFDALATGNIEQAVEIASPKNKTSIGLESKRKAEALMLGRDAAKAICDDLAHLCTEARQVIYAKVINPIAGSEVIPLPLLEERYFSAKEVGVELNTSANNIGRLANANNLKTRDGKYGKFFLDKSAHSDKQVEAFRYNANGIARLRELIGAANDSTKQAA